MKKYIHNYIVTFQHHYNLTDYQLKQLHYLFLTLLSEVTKLILLSIIFYDDKKNFIFAAITLLFLRTASGGLHFNTYLGCLSFSALYFVLCIKILPYIILPQTLMLLLLLLEALINYYIGAITSSKRPKPTRYLISRSRKYIILYFLSYFLLLLIFPHSNYLYISFWVITLHTFQLIYAYILEKGGILKHVS